MSTENINQDPRDLGFGTKIDIKNKRYLNTDGSFNIRRVGSGLGAIHPYQYLVSISWLKFWLITVGFYLVANCIFALLYMATGIENLSHSDGHDVKSDFFLAFFFSSQTITTVGYGTISPMSFTSSLIASFEALFGLLSFALITGVLYGRFARPSAKIRFSKRILISPYQDINGLQFRIVNRRMSQLIDIQVQFFLIRYEETGKDPSRQKFYSLALERDKISLFPLNWTIVHPIDRESPIYPLEKYTTEYMMKQNTEFIILIQAYDDTFAQTVHARYSYKAEDLVRGARFLPMYHTDQDGIVVLEINKTDVCEYAALNPTHVQNEETQASTLESFNI